ncbi:MAG: response regulator [Planctomycetes bacterium]|nr:response regulator [Planctomycetota bacterium]
MSCEGGSTSWDRCTTGDEGQRSDVPADADGPGDDRILVWAPPGSEAPVDRAALDLPCRLLPTAADLLVELASGAGAVVVPGEALNAASVALLSRALAGQPAWSDLPLIVLAAPEALGAAPLERLALTANVTLLERPVPTATLQSVLRAALRARRRQYDARDRRAALGSTLAPLAAIRNAAALLEKDLCGTGPAARLREVITRQSERLILVVEELMGPGGAAARLPALPLYVAPAPPAAGDDEAPRGRLVLVEDNDDIRACMGELLTAWGFAVDPAADGQAGLDLLLVDPPPVAIVDVGLPKLDGYDIARRVRARHGRRVRLIAVTGYGQAQDRERALQAGFDEHLVKPVDPDTLAELLVEGGGGRVAVAG